MAETAPDAQALAELVREQRAERTGEHFGRHTAPLKADDGIPY